MNTILYLMQLIVGGAVYIATVSADYTVSDSVESPSPHVLDLTPSGADRGVLLPTPGSGNEGVPYLIRNGATGGSYNLLIKGGTSAVPTRSTIGTLAATGSAIAICYNDGTVFRWRYIALSSVLGVATANDWTAAQKFQLLEYGASSTLTINAGTAVASRSYHKLETEGAAASDDLDSLTGGIEGQQMLLKLADASHNVVIKHGIGANLFACPGAADITLDVLTDWVLVEHNGTQWTVVAASTLTGFQDDSVVVASIAVANSGTNDAALTLQLKRKDNATNIASARQVLIGCSLTQYQPFLGEPAVASITFGTATIGSIIASGSGWALVQTDATGAFACTATDTDNETAYFSVSTARGGLSDMTKRCLVLGSNSDAATWS